ncbi:hypothetical protein VSS74_30970, partial [Conexibacter stalactiti]
GTQPPAGTQSPRGGTARPPRGSGGGARKPPGGSGRGTARPRLALTASYPRLGGRVITLRLRLGTRSRVTVAVRRHGRVVSRGTARGVRAGARDVRVRLDRPLAPGGRYRVRVTASAGGRTVARALALEVAPR